MFVEIIVFMFNIQRSTSKFTQHNLEAINKKKDKYYYTAMKNTGKRYIFYMKKIKVRN
jgi:hypothetical protein